MLADIFLAPSFFSFGHGGESKKLTVERFLTSLVNANEYIGSAVVRLMVAENTEQLLAVSGCYPDYQALDSAISANGLNDYFEIRDIRRWLNSLLVKPQRLEHVTNIVYALAENKIIENPAQELGAPDVTDLENDNIVKFAVGGALGRLDSKHLIFVGGSLIKENENHESKLTVSVSGNILDVECANGSNVDACPFDIKSVFPYSCFVDEAVREIDFFSCGSYFSKENAANFINLAIGGLDEKPYFTWSINDGFCDSVIKLAIHNSRSDFESLLRACAYTVTNSMTDKTHHLRTGQGGGDPQRECNGWKAWRRDITHEYHLHYWVSGRHVKFASCVVHNVFSIPTPT